MPPVSRGFHGRRADDADASRTPPGQYLVRDFPVLSAGPTPHTPLDQWSLTIDGAVDAVARWSWAELLALPSQTFNVDIHCVTKWSKLDTSWRGVSLDVLLEDVETAADFAMVHSYGGYTTNLPLEDLLDGQAWLVHTYEGEELPPHHHQIARRQHDPHQPAERPARIAHAELGEETAGAVAARNDFVGPRDIAEDPRRRGPRLETDREVMILFKSDQIENPHHRLPDRKVFEAGGELSRTATAVIVDPVIAVGRGAKLAEPAEDRRGRCLDRDAPEVRGIEGAREVVAGEVEILLGGLDAPVGGQWAHGGSI